MVATSFSILLILAYTYYAEIRRKTAHEDALTSIKALASEGSLPEALNLSVLAFPTKGEQKIQKEWIRTEIDIISRLRHLNRIEYWAEKNAELLDENDIAVLNWVRVLMHQRQLTRAISIIEVKIQNSENPGLWYLCYADCLIVEGNTKGAEKYLRGISLEGDLEAFRLIRLAMLAAGDRSQVDTYLTEAVQNSPTTPDLRAFLAQTFELRRELSLAEREYLAAHYLDPENPIWANMVTDFFIRRGKFHTAVRFMDRLNPHKIGTDLTVKKRFLKDLITGWSAFADSACQHFDSSSQQEIFCCSLPKQFWPTKSENTYAWSYPVLKRTEPAWLALLQLIQDGNEMDAADFYISHRDSLAKFSILAHDVLGKLFELRLPNKEIVTYSSFSQASSIHPALAELLNTNDESDSEDRVFLKTSTNAYASVFMALGWLEAALQLHQTTTEEIPGWYTYGRAQALRYNRSIDSAIEYLNGSGLDRLTRCLLGELYISTGDHLKANAILENLQNIEDDVAFRAAWLITTLTLEEKNYSLLKEQIQNYAVLTDTAYQRDLVSILELNGHSIHNTDTSNASNYVSSVSLALNLGVSLRDKDTQASKSMVEELKQRFPSSARVHNLYNWIHNEWGEVQKDL